MGKRNRQRTKLAAPPARYADAEGSELELRGSLSAASRRRYADTLASGLHREDARARAIEELFEHLAASWTIAGVRTDRPRELLGRYRVATASERAFVLDSLRAHLAERFPEMQAP